MLCYLLDIIAGSSPAWTINQRIQASLVVRRAQSSRRKLRIKPDFSVHTMLAHFTRSLAVSTPEASPCRVQIVTDNTPPLPQGPPDQAFIHRPRLSIVHFGFADLNADWPCPVCQRPSEWTPAGLQVQTRFPRQVVCMHKCSQERLTLGFQRRRPLATKKSKY